MKTSPTVHVDRQALRPSARIWLWTGIGVVGALILYLTFLNFTPALRSAGSPPESLPVDIPDYDYASWRALPVQHLGRYKPFETACNEVMRQIHGREKMNGQNATAIVLSWMLEADAGMAARSSKWDDHPFILCSHENARKVILGLDDNGALQTSDDLHGKYVSPKQLRTFLARMQKLRQDNLERAEEMFKQAGDGLSEAFSRLELYESIRGIEKQRDYASPMAKSNVQAPTEPFMFVALDKVPGSPWFSMSDLRLLKRDGTVWTTLYMADRVKQALPLYIMSTEHRDALEKFQAHIKAGTAAVSINELRSHLAGEREKLVARYRTLRQAGDKGDNKDEEAAKDFLITIARNMPQELMSSVKQLAMLMEDEKQSKQDKTDQIAQALHSLLAKRDERLIISIEQQLPKSKEAYDPADPTFHMLHLAYMETRYPDIYREVTNAQPVPLKKIDKVLIAFADVARAYRTGKPERFEGASQAFFKTVESESTPPYPGQDTIGDRVHAVLTGANLNPPDRGLLALEQTFNGVAPFQKAWVLMLVSMLFFCLSLGLNSRWCYLAAWIAFLGSLAFQLFGFFVRVTISGRPPVTNMYETVVWVAFMSAIFGAILEAVYRKKVIALAAALVATVGLVLADQMPLALDPKINPLVPVLRSNFWLTIHVLTIVSSYAGGTLAWGLGNVALFLIIFSKNKADTIKVLSNFTYRAMQIAVLLLAAGTFLGGWWAAYSWGRFWGWDPKETGALIALVCYVIPLHMRYIGWIRDFGLAVSAIVCYAAVLMSWYGVNFIFPAGLHAYGRGDGGELWVYWACLLNIEWVLVATWMYWNKREAAAGARPLPADVSVQAPALPSSEAIRAPSAVAPTGGETASEHVQA